MQNVGDVMGFESFDVIETINEIFVFFIYLLDLSFLFLEKETSILIRTKINYYCHTILLSTFRRFHILIFSVISY